MSQPPPETIAESAPASFTHWATICTLTGLSYFLAGWLGVQLTLPPVYASPLYPSAGIALACALVYGWRTLPPIALCAFALNIALAAPRGLSDKVWLASLCIGLGSAAQAGLGAALIRCWVKQPSAFSELRDIMLLYGLGAAVACTVGASIATLALASTGIVDNAVKLWITWWIGDALGVLIATPIALTLIGQPRPDWAPRRITVGLPLFIALALLAAAIVQTARDDAQDIARLFKSNAAHAHEALNTALITPLHALRAAHAATSAGDITGTTFQQAVRPWLTQTSTLSAMGWTEKDPARGAEHNTPRHEPSLTPGLIETRSASLAPSGFNLMSFPSGRVAVTDAIRKGNPVATWVSSAQGESLGLRQPGVVVIQAVYEGAPLDDTQRIANFRGLVWVSFEVQALLNTVMPRLRYPVKLCLEMLHDKSLTEQEPDLIHPSCSALTTRVGHATESLHWAERDWQLQVTVDQHGLPETGHFGTRTLAVIGLLCVAMLGALLLKLTGRARRIQVAVKARTSELLQQIKEREITENQLRESEQRLSNIFNNLPLGVVYTNLEGRIKQANSRFCNLLGYSASELLEMNALDYIHPEDVEQENHMVAQLVAESIPLYSQKKRLVRQDKQVVWVHSTVSLLRDGQGRPRRIVAAVEDITEHLRLAEAERAREAAESSNQAKSIFLSRMSHELRTPLNAMLGFAQLLDLDNRHRLQDTQRTWVAQIQKAGWHLLDMINDVMDLSRIESGNLRLQEQNLDVFELLSSTLPLIEADAKQRKLTVSHTVSSNAGLVRGDATRVKQILTNLLTNAVKYNVDGGRIHVACRARGNMVEIAISDTGLGLSPEQMAELFQPFNRLGRDRSNIEGTGIGLVISQRLAEWMGGSLRVHSHVGRGSIFTVSLPRVDAPNTEESSLDQPAITLSTYHRRRVHYVEDNETNVEVMRGILAQRPQIELSVSLTGLDGLADIDRIRPDVVLLDMHLPDISGMDLLRRLKADSETESIPVVIVSADALNAQIEEALQIGAQSYLTKPVNVTELLSMLDDILMSTDTVFG